MTKPERRLTSMSGRSRMALRVRSPWALLLMARQYIARTFVLERDFYRRIGARFRCWFFTFGDLFVGLQPGQQSRPQTTYLNIEAGQFVGVVGKSGSGKSTLLNMVAGIDRPSAGSVTVARIQIDGLSENKLALWRGRNVGFVFQFF